MAAISSEADFNSDLSFPRSKTRWNRYQSTQLRIPTGRRACVLNRERICRWNRGEIVLDFMCQLIFGVCWRIYGDERESRGARENWDKQTRVGKGGKRGWVEVVEEMRDGQWRNWLHLQPVNTSFFIVIIILFLCFRKSENITHWFYHDYGEWIQICQHRRSSYLQCTLILRVTITDCKGV